MFSYHRIKPLDSQLSTLLFEVAGGGEKITGPCRGNHIDDISHNTSSNWAQIFAIDLEELQGQRGRGSIRGPFPVLTRSVILGQLSILARKGASKSPVNPPKSSEPSREKAPSL